MVTIRDVARRAGVSVASVSRALNNYPDINADTKVRILDVVRELRYYPSASARNLVTHKSRTIGVLYRTDEGFSHPHLGDVLNVFQDAIGNHGYDMLIFSDKQRPFGKWGALDRIRHRAVDGVLVIGGVEDDLEGLLQSDLPLVGIDFVGVGKNMGSVMSDNRRAIHDIVITLSEAGYREIGFVHGPLQLQVALERLQGFYSGMGQLGIAVSDEWIFGGNFTFATGQLVGRELLDLRRRPEVVVCSADVVAIGLMQVLLGGGLRIPEDIGIVGFDDIEMARYVYPALTSIAQDKHEVGRKAAEFIVESMAESEETTRPMHYVLPTRLVQRQTTRPLRTP
ncbi:MAG: LacI family DNA-binding transcriptional regulator [Acidimicrobiales bacterium]